MPARRDYALVWRDSIATLAQLPVAALSASDYFSREWVGRSRAFMMRVVDRLVLARPADAGPLDNVMADVLADDLTDATTAFVRDLVSLPGQTAMHFNQCVEAMINEVLTRVQPDAGTDARKFVVDELDKLDRELSRLREVAGAETARRALGARTAAASPGDRHDATALRRLRADIEAIAARRAAGRRPAGSRDEMLSMLQSVLNAAQTRFDAKEAPRALPGEQTARRRIAVQNARAKIREARAELRDLVRPPRRNAR